MDTVVLSLYMSDTYIEGLASDYIATERDSAFPTNLDKAFLKLEPDTFLYWIHPLLLLHVGQGLANPVRGIFH